MGSVFRFKQFEVDQADCAMKINTDGVLMGAKAWHKEPKSILDIGTGTGVISLMLAQRFPAAVLHAVEVDEPACLRAQANFINSPFADRLQAYHCSFEQLNTGVLYDLIVSNPPFYTRSLHNPDPRKQLAKHTDMEFFTKLLYFAVHNLNTYGSLHLIIPPTLADELVEHGQKIGLFLAAVMAIKSFNDSEVFRKLIVLNREASTQVQQEELVIYQEKGRYTDAYKSLLHPFFLAF